MKKLTAEQAESILKEFVKLESLPDEDVYDYLDEWRRRYNANRGQRPDRY